MALSKLRSKQQASPSKATDKHQTSNNMALHRHKLHEQQRCTHVCNTFPTTHTHYGWPRCNPIVHKQADHRKKLDCWLLYICWCCRQLWDISVKCMRENRLLATAALLLLFFVHYYGRGRAVCCCFTVLNRCRCTVPGYYLPLQD